MVGGAIAPTLLAWGLQRAGATVGALLLNLEAVFTVLLARAIYREPIGRVSPRQFSPWPSAASR